MIKASVDFDFPGDLAQGQKQYLFASRRSRKVYSSVKKRHQSKEQRAGGQKRDESENQNKAARKES